MPPTVASIDVTLRLLGADAFQSQMRTSGSVTEQTGARVTRAVDGISGATGRLVQASTGLGRTDAAIRGVGVAALQAEVQFKAYFPKQTWPNLRVVGRANLARSPYDPAAFVWSARMRKALGAHRSPRWDWSASINR